MVFAGSPTNDLPQILKDNCISNFPMVTQFLNAMIKYSKYSCEVDATSIPFDRCKIAPERSSNFTKFTQLLSSRATTWNFEIQSLYQPCSPLMTLPGLNSLLFGF
jgi:hypothetical protein